MFIRSCTSIITFLLLMAHNAQNSPYSTIFAHGIADSQKQAHTYCKYDILPTCPYFSFNFPDATFKFHHTSLGQTQEIECLAHVYERCFHQRKMAVKNPKFILYGMSRGASAILNFVGLHQPQAIKALVLESPFDSMETIIIHALQGMGVTPTQTAISRGHTIVSYMFRQYHPNGYNPIDTIQNIPKNVPILIICSRHDQRVPYYSSLTIYKKLREYGHKKVHILILNDGKHAKMLYRSDYEAYRNCVHAFYKKYNIPHNAEYADLGAPLIQSTQPQI